jgi:hypothetical protein
MKQYNRVVIDNLATTNNLEWTVIENYISEIQVQLVDTGIACYSNDYGLGLLTGNPWQNQRQAKDELDCDLFITTQLGYDKNADFNYCFMGFKGIMQVLQHYLAENWNKTIPEITLLTKKFDRYFPCQQYCKVRGLPFILFEPFFSSNHEAMVLYQNSDLRHRIAKVITESIISCNGRETNALPILPVVSHHLKEN